MFSILGRKGSGEKFCDGHSRRDFLTIGSLAMGGLALPDLLRAESQLGRGRSHKAIINVFLPGGPPHQDMWDIKPDAPAEIRGEFKPIATNVPGIQIGELFPKIAAMMDKFTVVRSIVGANGGHAAHQAVTGFGPNNAPAGGWPSQGAWISKVQGPVNQSVPAHCSLFYKTGHGPWGDPGNGGFLGLAHAPFRLVGGKGETNKTENMVLQGITLDRLQDRNALLNSIDGIKRTVDATGSMVGMDAFTNQAVGILTSSRLVDAMNITKEDDKTLARYGKGDPTFRADGAPKMTENFLIARRLVEAGARCVSLNFSRWDWHGGNFKRAREDMPMLDAAVSSLVQDLHDRGMDRDVSVVVWGEFGRTPKINANAGRDHWPRVSTALIAGGGMNHGQVIGETNRLGEHPIDRPVTFAEITATLYHQIGFNLRAIREFDLRGRPFYPVDPNAKPMVELV
ncbi:MAG: DUF1501 domain-containing protein [Pirellulaceae bacterium]|nr:DUF1501 domain-containing protein [Pirellulaceae bacterium]